jgi:hypothetical protein
VQRNSGVGDDLEGESGTCCEEASLALSTSGPAPCEVAGLTSLSSLTLSASAGAILTCWVAAGVTAGSERAKWDRLETGQAIYLIKYKFNLMINNT